MVGTECRIRTLFICLIFIFNTVSANNLEKELNGVNEILKSIKPNNPVQDLSFLLETHGYNTDGKGNLILSDGSLWKIQENGTIKNASKI